MKAGTKNRACTGKIRHTTRADAVEHLERMVRRGAFPTGLTVYQCRHCAGGWHLGHRPGRRNG